MYYVFNRNIHMKTLFIVQIENDIGKCEDVYKAVQMASDSVCVVLLEPFVSIYFHSLYLHLCVLLLEPFVSI